MGEGNTLVIIGASGMLGHALGREFPDARRLDVVVEDPRIQKTDITNRSVLEQSLEGMGPGDWVINAAADTDVDGAEISPGEQRSHAINVEGPRNLAQVASERGFRVLHFSTAYVFSGVSGRYPEDAAPHPINNYGRYKLSGETPILEGGGIVLRTDALYGSNGNNFVDAIRMLATGKDELEVVDDQIGSPTLTEDLARMTRAVLSNGVADGQIFHAVNQGSCSRAELADAIVQTLRIDCRILRTTTVHYNETYRRDATSAMRPADCSLSTEKLDALYSNRQWDHALESYLQR